MTQVRYSIITPTILRSSLKRLCDSVDQQTEKNYEHILQVDYDQKSVADADEQMRLLRDVGQANWRRKVWWCGEQHTNGCGNTCRSLAWEKAIGEYVFYIDDDDFFLTMFALEYLNKVTKTWALFPILRHGQRFFHNPPQPCLVTTGQFLIRRDAAKWPDIPQYESDAYIIERLKAQHPDYEVLPDLMLVSSPQSSFGRL